MSPERSVHFVGSYPADNAQEAMTEMLELGGDHLHTLSDGETGDRRDWIVGQIDFYRENPAFTLIEDGDWSSYDPKDIPQFAVAPGHELTPEDFGLKYHRYAMEAWPILERLREEHGRPDLRLQVGIPHAFDMTFFTFGLAGAMDKTLRETYAQATLQQMEAIRNEAFGDQVTFQIETPASLSLSLLDQSQLPREFKPGALGEDIAELAARAPTGSVFGIHLCLGDLNNESRGQLQTRMPSVKLGHSIELSWSDEQRLDYVHEPIAAGSKPPIMDEAAYEDLRRLYLPADTRYIAGMVHEAASMEEQIQVLRWVEKHTPEGQRIGLAAACGLARRQCEKAQEIGRRTTDLALLNL